MSRKLKNSLSLGLKTLKSKKINFWQSLRFSDCFNDKGELNFSQIKITIPTLIHTSHQDALKHINDVIRNYEQKGVFGKLWFRWTKPYPIKTYYQLYEINVLHLLNKNINETGQILNPIINQFYYLSRLPARISWIDRLTKGWRMQLHANNENLRKKEDKHKNSVNLHLDSYDSKKNNIFIQKNMEKMYEEFKLNLIHYIFFGVFKAVKSNTNGLSVKEKLNEIKKGIIQTNRATYNFFNDFLKDFPLLNPVSEKQKNTYFKSMKRWEVFGDHCWDVLADIPSDTFETELKKMDEVSSDLNKQFIEKTNVSLLKLKEDVWQHLEIAKQKLENVYKNSHKEKTKKKALSIFEQETNLCLGNSCSLFPSKTLHHPEVINFILGLSYEVQIWKENIKIELEDKPRSYEIPISIHYWIEEASKEDTMPEHIPELIKNLTLALDKVQNPPEQIFLFNKILLWQNRYIEAVSWNYTKNNNILIEDLGEQYKQQANILYRRLALQFHPDKCTNQENSEHMKTLSHEKDEHNKFIDKLLNSLFATYREKSSWLISIEAVIKLERVNSGPEGFKIELDQLNKRWEKEVRDSAQLRVKIDQADKQIETNGMHIKQIEEILNDRQRKMEASQQQKEIIESSAIPTSTADYLEENPPKNYTPKFSYSAPLVIKENKEANNEIRECSQNCVTGLQPNN